MNLYKQFKTNPDLEKSGIFVEYGNNSKGEPISFKVARAGGNNLRYTKYLEAKLKPHRRLIQLDSMDSKLLESIILDAFCNTVLISWSGVEDESGKEIKFSPEAAITLFTDLPELYKDLQVQCANASLFRAEILENDVKNL